MRTSQKRGLVRLSIALLVPWFLYWAWRLFLVMQQLWALESERVGLADWYDQVRQERDHILVVAIGFPVSVLAVILTARWVYAGFRSDGHEPTP